MLGALVTIILASACRDDVTGPLRPTIEPAQLGSPRRIIAPDPAKESPSSGSWSGVVSPWDGGTDLGDPWYFYYPTLIVITIAGEVTQGAGAYPATGSVWPATGLVDGTGMRSGMIGYRIASTTGSAMFWPATTTDTALVQTEMRPTRAAINGAQPYQYPNPFSCGSYNNQTPRWACYTYTGSATLSFTRPTAKLTLARAGSGPVSSTTPVTFTVGSIPAKFGSTTVPISGLQWNWLPYGNTNDVVLSCGSGALTCTLTFPTSGTLYVSAYVNGEWEYESIDIDVIGSAGPIPCADVPEVAGDFPQLTGPASDDMKRKLWKDSRIRQQERGGFLDDAGTLDPTGWNPLGSCKIVPPTNVPSSARGSVHTHFAGAKGDDGTALCGGPSTLSGESASDGDMAMAAVDWRDLDMTNFILSERGIVMFRYNDPSRTYPDGPRPLLEKKLLPRCGY